MKSQKELKEEWLNVWNQFHTEKLTIKQVPDYIVELVDGSLLSFRKPNMETVFIYPDHLDDAEERVCKVKTDPEYFISENLRESCDKPIEMFRNSIITTWIQSSKEFPADCKIKFIVPCGLMDEDRATPLYSEDRMRIVSLFEIIRVDFEKRLRSYVKRYGLKRVEAWSYWANR